jgi:uncharacterized protein YoxC
VADLRTRFIEDYAGGLLNVARQELSSTGEVLAQDGFTDNQVLFVEDGRGVKSGLKLGAGLMECVDPSTEEGVLNVRSADRTYAKIRDLKIFATAVASAQAALSESVSETFANFETAFESLESDLESTRSEFLSQSGTVALDVQGNSGRIDSLEEKVSELESLAATEVPDRTVREVVAEAETPAINDNDSVEVNLAVSQYFGLVSVETDIPAWVTLYTSRTARNRDSENIDDPRTQGTIASIVTSLDNPETIFAPAILGYSEGDRLYVRVINLSGGRKKINLRLRYIRF